MAGNYRYLDFEDRKKIEAWHARGDRPLEIAARLGVHTATIYHELQRGYTGEVDAAQREVYSAERAQAVVRENFKRRGRRAVTEESERKGCSVMKKYQLGALTVSDKGLQDTKEEIVIELIDRMQKYVAEGKAAYENGDYTEEQKLNTITNLCGRFCGLAEFLQITMGIDVRRADGLLYTQEMYNHFHYWKMNLEIEIGRERETAGGFGGD